MPAGDPPLTLRDLHNLPVARVRKAASRAFGALTRTGIDTILDLLQHYPRRYLDRTRRADVAELALDEDAYIVGEVFSLHKRTTHRGKALVTMVVHDGTGAVELAFFNQPWVADKHRQGDTVIAFGRIKPYRGYLQMSNPVIDELGDRTGRLVPIYPQSSKEGLRTWDVGRFVNLALNLAEPRTIADPLPPPIRRELKLISRHQAFNRIHRPEEHFDHVRARKRLAFDELLRVQLELVRRKRTLEQSTVGFSHATQGELLDAFHQGLPFELTAAQKRVTSEIAADLAKATPMHRLLQGDVGSGKTLVAVGAMLTSVQGGLQAALMAPTEVLAEQHHATIAALLADLEVDDPSVLTGSRPLRVDLLTSRLGAQERRRTVAGLAGGEVDIVVGTHALISQGVEYQALGVVVIDEQHRFGVQQRAELRDRSRGLVPDMLVMTATPIPRTAAMTVYGDLDVSTLDELPPGRMPVATIWAAHKQDETRVWQALRDAVAEGRQGYVVCPLIEDSEASEARSATDIYQRLTAPAGALAGLKVGMLHGRVTSAEKESTMALFRAGRLQVLVATTVIEVGVDVPNATVMVVIDAAHFGMAQLHQLRGRVGRGTHPSSCYLMGGAPTAESQARLEALVATTDGFELAEVDLELRGEGTIMGERQKGRNDLRLASLRHDKDLVALARQVAFDLFDAPGGIAACPALADELDFAFGEDEAAEFLLKG